jgi:hypothetical protein
VRVPSTAVICREFTERFAGTVSGFFSPSVTIPLAPMITGMSKRFIFHFQWISILRFLYSSSFSASFCVILLSDGIATSISKQISSVLFPILMSGLLPITSLSVCTPSFHSTVTSSCSRTALDMCQYQFSAVSMANFLYIV